MADLYSIETAGLYSRPVVKAATPAYGGRVRRYRGTITLAAQATTDNILLCIVPAGQCFSFGMLTSTVTLGTSVIAVGTNKVHASNGQYRAAAVNTAVDTPQVFGLTAAQAGAALSSDTPVYLTIATAALPGAGTLVVDIYTDCP